MKRLLFFLSIALLVVSGKAGWCREPAPVPERTKKKAIRIEFYGGFSSLDGGDLNLQGRYEQSYAEFFFDNSHGYYHSLYGDSYTYTRDITGSFPEIKDAFPLGVRLKYNITPTVAVSVGFQYLSRTAATDVYMHQGVRALRFDYYRFYDQYDDRHHYLDYTLAVRGYVPLLGLHLMTRRTRRIQVEAFLSGGPLFADTRISYRQEWRKTGFNGYWRGDDSAFEIKGNGTGLAVEAGVRFNIPLFKQCDFFLEGGYACQVVGTISGPARYQYQGKDANAVADEEIYAWEGEWVLEEVYAERYWGTFHSYKPMVYYGGLGDNVDEFGLDLSGFRLKGGISYRF